MQGPQRQYFLLLFALTFVLVNCGQNQVKTLDSVFPQSAKCEGQALANSYVALWEDGRITTETASSRNELAANFVTPNLQKLKKVEPNYKMKLEDNEISQLNSPPPVSQADNWGASRVQAEAFWQAGYYGNNIIVAVIDTGVDRTHPQLANRIYVNPDEIASNGIDDDHNGYIDDVNGWDFVTNSKNIIDHNLHGTHVSGIIAAEHNDARALPMHYVQGVAPQAKIMSLAFLDSSGYGSLDAAIGAIRYASANGARVINASWGGEGCSMILQQEIMALATKGIFFVAASGNGDENGTGINLDRFPYQYPAVFNGPSQFTVGAVGLFDHMTSFSNYGRANVHIFAPGQYIISTIPGGQMASLSGTSMATPFVSGALALMLQVKPTISSAEARQVLYDASFKASEFQNAAQGRMALPQVLTSIVTH